ncbi:MAG: hypothetical protein Q9209_007769 [Squamulea sp. 1 TL-2023]
MDHVPIANLEAELSCFDEDLPIVAPRRNHGDQHHFFEMPNEATTNLDPPSKTKSVYPFGIDGTLAWTTSAGELLQVANCIDNRLVGADYKRSIESGREYYDRGKVLERALESPQGQGFGIGLSLGGFEPAEKSWLYNRWPRFSGQHNGLDIVLQYFVRSQWIVQEYHIRNTGQEDVSLPYTISSDICFREHRADLSSFRPVPAGKSGQRLILYQNTEVLIRNDIENCQLKMALFLNSERQRLWIKTKPNEELENRAVHKSSAYSDEELDKADQSLRSRVLKGQLVDEDQDVEVRRTYRKCYDTAWQSASDVSTSLATHKSYLDVPAGSTQELRAVVQLSSILHQESGSSEPQPDPIELKKKQNDDDGQHNSETGERIRSRQRMLLTNTKQISSKNPGKDGKSQLTKIINDHITIGLAFASIDSVAEARYHLFMACLIAEYLYIEGSYTLSNARFIYAKFLYTHGWHLKALEILEKLSDSLPKVGSSTKKFTALRKKVQMRLACMYLETGGVAKAEKIYQSFLSSPVTEQTVLEPVSARCLERMAWAQVKQNKYGEAHTSYSVLLRHDRIQRQTILINLGFIEKKLGRGEDARRHFEDALQANRFGLAIDRFQFKLLTQVQRYIDSTQDEEEYRLEFSERIKATCQGHLVWTFQIAKLGDTWSNFHLVGGDPYDNIENPAAEEMSTSYAIEGAWNFSKLWLYLSTWDTEWEFIIDLLHSSMKDWLLYLARRRHMKNLWVERHSSEALRPYNTISPDYTSISNLFPQYHLSDFTMLWLALQQLEHLITSIGNHSELRARKEDDPIRHKLNDIRQAFEGFQQSLGSRKIRTNILKTFMIPTQDGSSTETSVDRKVSVNPETNDFHIARITVPIDVSPTWNEPHSFQGHQTSKITRQILAYRRTVTEYGYVIQSNDIATIEAAIAGFFEDSEEQISLAWQENLKLLRTQQDQSITNFDPLRVALTLFASKFKYTLANSSVNDIERECLARLAIALYDSGFFARIIVGNAPEPMRSWSGFTYDTYETLSILVGGLFAACRFTLPSNDVRKDGESLQNAEIANALQKTPPSFRKASVEIPQYLGTPAKAVRTNVVNDSKFMPEWMYHYPPYIHEQRLQIDIDQESKSIDGFNGFKTAFSRWSSSKGFSKSREVVIFPPHVADSGTKGGAGGNSDPTQRPMDIKWFGTAEAFYDRLVQPRTFDHAKKRLVELTSHKQEAAFICWLGSPEQEKFPFLEFLGRHGSSESFFGERVDWRGNIWDTELHLGFYQLLSEEDNKRFRPPHLDYHSQLRIKKMPSLSQSPLISEITPCSISIRFVGDLRDRSWTCHFLSSVARRDGFTGLVDEFTDARIGENSLEEFYIVNIGQRKILEMAYVERILTEMVQSCEDILVGFQRELDVPETREPQSESYEFIDNYSRLHSKAAEILLDIFKQLDLSVKTIEDWEKREDIRDIQSRWSEKDENRHGKRLKDLGRKCKLGLSKLRRIKDRLDEQQKLAQQRHTNLINYMNLQTARTSSQSAEDVRLFTYVTIIFLPLSFSSSLFSMQDAPQSGVLHIMIPTTVIALAMTIFVLANMKSLDRNFNFLVYRINASARSKMRSSKHPWGFSWNRKWKELEESAKLQLKPKNDKHLPAQSKWWYFLFWLSYALKLPRLYVMEGFQTWNNRKETAAHNFVFLVRILLSAVLFPTCLFIFTAQLVIITVVDLFELLWKAMRLCKKTMFQVPASDKSPKKRSKKSLKKSGEDIDAPTIDSNDEDDQDPDVSRRRFSESSRDSSYTPGKFDSNLGAFSTWLQTPPRPIKGYVVKKLDVPHHDLEVSEPPLAEPDLEDGPLVESDKMYTDEDEWEIAIDQGLAEKDKILMRSSPSGFPLQRQPSDESYKEKPSFWGRWNTKFKNGKNAESKV